ncbi:MAG: DUF3617 domain-containing protein [Erythrobacter sp.]
MKPLIILAAASSALLIAGCSGGKADGDRNVTIKEAARKAESAGLRPEPGQYQATITMTGIEFPGMPPEMKGHGAGLTRTVDYCLTQQEVDKGFEEMMKRGQNGECLFERFKLDGGKMDAVMVCKTSAGQARMQMTGAVTPTTADFTATTAMDFEGVGEGTMTFTTKHQRTGDCPTK